jgi:hypothetical protein
MFPAHAAGAALLLLRFCVAGLLLLGVGETNYSLAVAVKVAVLIVVVCLLGMGLFTPIACGISVLLQIGTLGSVGVCSAVDTSFHIALSICLCLLGPGAFSLDARRFGRRVITRPPL